MKFIKPEKDKVFEGVNNSNKCHEIRCTYHDLVSIFGKPQFCGNSGDGKVNFMWSIIYEGENIFIQNWKNLKPYQSHGYTFEEVVKKRIEMSFDVRFKKKNTIEIIKEFIENKRKVLTEKQFLRTY